MTILDLITKFRTQSHVKIPKKSDTLFYNTLLDNTLPDINKSQSKQVTIGQYPFGFQPQLVKSRQNCTHARRKETQAINTRPKWTPRGVELQNSKPKTRLMCQQTNNVGKRINNNT